MSDRETSATYKSFEDLWIWQETRILVTNIYKDFGPGTLGYRDFGFKDQIQRAVISIMNNTAEGFERSTQTEYARFLDIAKGSCGEVRSMLYAAQDLGYVTEAVADQRRTQAVKISKGIASLIACIREG